MSGPIPRVTVIVPPSASGSRELLSSLDRQSLPAAEFEVLVGDDERSPELTARLDDLVRHRTNLARVPGGDVAALLERAAGEYVVGVPTGRTLAVTALAELADRADATSADLVLGRTARAGVRPDAPVGPSGALPATSGRLRRRSATTADDLGADLAGDPAAEAGAGAAVAEVLCFLDGDAPDRAVPDDLAGAGTLAAVEATWRDGALHLVLEAPGTDRVGASLWSDTTGDEWPLGDVEPDGGRLVLRIDPADVPGLGAIPDGVWWPTLRVGPERTPTLVEAAPARAHGASFRARTAVSFAEGRRLGLDVGARARQPLRRIDPARTTVVEDSRGSLLTAPVRNLDLGPGARIDGALRLGKMPVVAWLEDDGAGPVLRAWVSGLAGESALFTRFARAPYAPVGAQLVIDGVGAMTVTPVTKEAPAPVDAPAKSPAAHSAPASPVSRARRLAGRALRSVRG